MGTYSNLNYYFKKIIQRLKVEFQDKDSEFHPKTKATQSPIIQLPAQQLQLRKLHATALLNYDLKQHSQNSHFHHVYQETQQSISSSNMPHQEACLTQRGEKLDLYTNRSQFASVSRSLPLLSSCYINKNASVLFFQITIYIKKSFYINTSMHLFLPS